MPLFIFLLFEGRGGALRPPALPQPGLEHSSPVSGLGWANKPEPQAWSIIHIHTSACPGQSKCQVRGASVTGGVDLLTWVLGPKPGPL